MDCEIHKHRSLCDILRHPSSLSTYGFPGGINTAAIPVQALAEFSSVVLRHFDPSPSFEDLQQLIEPYDRAFPVVPVTSPIVLETVRGVRDHKFSCYDAQIWAAARLNQIPCVLSEDFSDGATAEGITSINPLATGFKLNDL